MTQLAVIPDNLKDEVRDFFLQSFQMRGLQEEFKTINDDLKPSLQSRMKFEIIERIISDSPSFFYLRLFMM